MCKFNASKNNQISGLILTLNEEKHLLRCLNSVNQVCDLIYVVDSYSTDSTEGICSDFDNVIFVQNHFRTHADQIKWSLNNIDFKTDWLFRIDADEYLDDLLIDELNAMDLAGFEGFQVNRRIKFNGTKISKGGQFPIPITRLVKVDAATVDERPMDEHFQINGRLGLINKGELIDDNLNSIDWWFEKHMHYAKIEAIIQTLDKTTKESFNTGIKRRLYYLAPAHLGPILLFCYRFFLRGGIVAQPMEAFFLVFQTLWYHTLVSFYVLQIKNMKQSESEITINNAVDRLFGRKYSAIIENNEDMSL